MAFHTVLFRDRFYSCCHDIQLKGLVARRRWPHIYRIYRWFDVEVCTLQSTRSNFEAFLTLQLRRAAVIGSLTKQNWSALVYHSMSAAHRNNFARRLRRFVVIFGAQSRRFLRMLTSTCAVTMTSSRHAASPLYISSAASAGASLFPKFQLLVTSLVLTRPDYSKQQTVTTICRSYPDNNRFRTLPLWWFSKCVVRSNMFTQAGC